MKNRAIGTAGLLALAIAGLCSCDYPWPEDRSLTCGDGQINDEETCDGEALAGKTCKDLSFDGGTLKCMVHCGGYDTAGCYRCGDGKKNGPAEQCDRSDLDGKSCKGAGFDGGAIKCASDCKGFDTSGCFKCGDGAVSGTETCDGTNLGGKTCKDKGFTGGVLKCKPDCSALDASGCYQCGDGVINGTDKCDGTTLGGKTCKDLGFEGGVPACKPDCSGFDTTGCYKCGDGVINGTDLCDGTNLGSWTCKGLGFDGGTLKCKATCKALDPSGCHKCGDGVINGTEKCDGYNLASKTCKLMGFEGGALQCKADCSALVTSGCYKCGDGVKNGTDLCDGTDLGGQTCKGLGYTTGALACLKTCKLDETGCSRCGDGKVSGKEVCDGTLFGVKTCKDYSYFAGPLKCEQSCTAIGSGGCLHYQHGWYLQPTGAYTHSTGIHGGGITSDASGNYYVAGTFRGVKTFDTVKLTGSDNDLFAAKLDSKGKVAWALSAGGAGTQVGRDMAVDTSGNSVVVGSFEKSTVWGSTTLTSKGADDLLVARLDSAGKPGWAISAGSTGEERASAVAIDSSGNVLVAGRFSGSITLGSVTLTSAGSTDIFVAKLDSAGKAVWAVRAGGAFSDSAEALALDSSGDIYLTGVIDAGSSYFGVCSTCFPGRSVTLNTRDDAFAAKLDGKTGAFSWVKIFSGNREDMGMAVTVDSTGNSYFTGAFKSTSLSVGSATHTNKSFARNDAFVAKLDSAGKVLWSIMGGGKYDDLISGIALSSAGNLLLTGIYAGKATFGGQTMELTSGVSAQDIFVAKMDSAGKILWTAPTKMATLFPSTGSLTQLTLEGMAHQGGRTVFLSFFLGTVTLSNTTVANSGLSPLIISLQSTP